MRGDCCLFGCCLFPGANIIKFLLLQYRVLYGNMVSLVWNIYLALVQK